MAGGFEEYKGGKGTGLGKFTCNCPLLVAIVASAARLRVRLRNIYFF
jgi:hypothetical protein